MEWKSLKDNQKHDDVNDTSNGTAMPAKHTLELVLDTLQRSIFFLQEIVSTMNLYERVLMVMVMVMHFRRDTYEIFGQPVDPDEVLYYVDAFSEIHCSS